MANKKNTKTNIEASEAFLEYEEEIVAHPSFAGMPDLRRDDGQIQWETPSNRGSGKFQFSHDKRYKWWQEKAAQVGISTDEDKWISKVAKKIHPSKQRPCKVCGRIMDIRYCYLSANFIKRVQKLQFFDNSIKIDELTHITDFIATFVDTFGERGYASLPKLLKCTQVKSIPNLPNNLTSWISWIEQEYIPNEPSMLSPGAMSNAPDRLDGFHTYNRCCRPSADKGRSKENLASYSTDRRAFENWSDGNWITANKFMGFINSNATLKQQHCANNGNGLKHPRPCSADHIGPISLGFCHQPEFQLLCKSCNSSKNNRMYYSDVQHLISSEKLGKTVVSWYADSIWNSCKLKVTDKESALRLSRIMRDNRNISMMLLHDFMEHNEYLFLLSLLNLQYADYKYDIIPDSITIQNHIVSVNFTTNANTLKYVSIQKARKIRVAFSSLSKYAQKENRNGFMYTNSAIEQLKDTAFSKLACIDDDKKELNLKLSQILNADEPNNHDIAKFINNINYNSIISDKIFIEVKKILKNIMQLVANELSTKWNDPRYSREIEED